MGEGRQIKPHGSGGDLYTPAEVQTFRANYSLSDSQIKHMVERFLSWQLPEDFNPDGGISFDSTFNKGTKFEGTLPQPHGTNLLDARQAEEMIRYITEKVLEQ